MPEHSDDDGWKHHDDSEYLEAIEKGNQTTREIADTVGVHRQSAYERLHKLEDSEKVDKEKIGNSFRWTLVE